MEANTARFASVSLLLSVIALLASASADSGYGKSQYVSQNPVTPREHAAYEKTIPKMPTKPTMPKGEHVAYEKTNPKLPTIPVIPKEEHGSYEKNIPKLPTKPVIPKGGHGSYEKSDPKLPTKPVIQKEEHGTYEKSGPKLPTKPVIPKEEHGTYEKSDPKLPAKPVIPKEEHGAYEKSYPKLPTKPVIPKPEKSLLPNVPKHPKNVAVQGLIYCKYGSKLIPLQGATTKVTCLAVNKNGYGSKSVSFSSCPADEKGYFLAKVASSKLLKDNTWEITECKAFLKNSPWPSCKVPEDTNGGITGARAIFSCHLNNDGYCLSSVGPFIYNPGHESLPKEGY
ncbi:hypothetical protein L1987_86195 [Smallanthus sonchifolius]|uniref:Uncharacterized protein n=1 Tax=Smallanthus sonchifolius TaxID=185202 RepID=A0ACB8XXX7_9ASTR|nr:hypothetical protein L1987_86195 [Smallanthus sonchifolius]